MGASTSRQTRTKGSVLVVVMQVFELMYSLELTQDSLLGINPDYLVSASFGRVRLLRIYWDHYGQSKVLIVSMDCEGHQRTHEHSRKAAQLYD